MFLILYRKRKNYCLHCFRNDLLSLIDVIDQDPTLFADEIGEHIQNRGGSQLSVTQVNYWRRELGFRSTRVWRYATEGQYIQQLGFFALIQAQNYQPNQFVFLDESSVSVRHANRLFGYSRR